MHSSKNKIVLGSVTFDGDINIQCSLYCLSKLCMKKKVLNQDLRFLQSHYLGNLLFCVGFMPYTL